jgi:hypothetical protein
MSVEKLLDFAASGMLQHIDLTRILIDWMIPSKPRQTARAEEKPQENSGRHIPPARVYYLQNARA